VRSNEPPNQPLQPTSGAGDAEVYAKAVSAARG
jgi:hypothetical protein